MNMRHRTTKIAIVGLWLSLGHAGCSDSGSDDSDAMAKSCLTADSCYEVTDPEDYELGSECKLFGGSTSDAACDASKYTRKCTQVTQVSEGNGPEEDVTYVYYFAASNQTSCAGEEEEL